MAFRWPPVAKCSYHFGHVRLFVQKVTEGRHTHTHTQHVVSVRKLKVCSNRRRWKEEDGEKWTQEDWNEVKNQINPL